MELRSFHAMELGRDLSPNHERSLKARLSKKGKDAKDSMVQRTFSPIGRNIYSVHHSFSFILNLLRVNL